MGQETGEPAGWNSRPSAVQCAEVGSANLHRGLINLRVTKSLGPTAFFRFNDQESNEPNPGILCERSARLRQSA